MVRAAAKGIITIRKRVGWRRTCETGRHLEGYGVSSPRCGGRWFESPADSQSPGFMRRRVGVMRACPAQQCANALFFTILSNHLTLELVIFKQFSGGVNCSSSD